MQWRTIPIVLVVLITSCGDPVHDAEVDALGSERRGVRPGPTHRPGQNCRTCHGGLGPGEPEFAIAGTVYSARNFNEPLAGTIVELEDATHAKRQTVSNEVGNFYIGSTSWSPVYPLTVRLLHPAADEGGVKQMATSIGREGGCAFCHYGADNERTHEPPIYLREKAR